MKNRGFITIVLTIILVLVFIGIPLSLNAYLNNCDKRTITVEVTDKNVKNNGNNGKYLVYGKALDGSTTVLEITDSLIQGRWNSSDVYAEIVIGRTYKFTVVGKRIPLFSLYPNILSKEVVTNGESN